MSAEIDYKQVRVWTDNPTKQELPYGVYLSYDEHAATYTGRYVLYNRSGDVRQKSDILIGNLVTKSYGQRFAACLGESLNVPVSLSENTLQHSPAPAITPKRLHGGYKMENLEAIFAPTMASVPRTVSAQPSTQSAPKVYVPCHSCNSTHETSDLNTCAACFEMFCMECVCDCFQEPTVEEIFTQCTSQIQRHVDLSTLSRLPEFVLAVTDDAGGLLHVSGSINKCFTAPPLISRLLHKQLIPSMIAEHKEMKWDAYETREAQHTIADSESPWSISVIPVVASQLLYLVNVFSCNSHQPESF